jgi:hypothetical protein
LICGDLIIDVVAVAEGLRLRVKPSWEPGGYSSLVTVEDLRGLAMWLEAEADKNSMGK